MGNIISEDEIRELLEEVSGNLEPTVIENELEYYSGLYPDDLGEEEISKYINKYPKLQDLVVDILNKIIDLYDSGKSDTLLVDNGDDEIEAGLYFSKELALLDSKYCKLMEFTIAVQDIETNEEIKNQFIMEVINKWGINNNTLVLLRYKVNEVTDESEEFIENVKNLYSKEFKEYINQIFYTDFDIDEDDPFYAYRMEVEEDFEYDNSEEEYLEYINGDYNTSGNFVVANEMIIQNKKTLMTSTIRWEENYPAVLFLYDVYKIAYRYFDSSEHLDEYIENLKNIAKENDLAYRIDFSDFPVKHSIKWGDTEEIGVNFNPIDEITSESALELYRKNLEAYKDYPQTECEKIQFYLSDECLSDVWYFDYGNLRHLRMSNWDGSAYRVYDSLEEMNLEIENLLNEYKDEEYEIVLRENVNIAFDRYLELMEGAIENPEGKKVDYEIRYEAEIENSAGKEYYENAMDMVLSKMQSAIDKAAETLIEIIPTLKIAPKDLILTVFIDEDSCSMTFLYYESKTGYPEDAEDSIEFLTVSIGREMEYALKLMKVMDESGSTPLSQAVNNWIEDLGWDSLNELGLGDEISDSWWLLDY